MQMFNHMYKEVHCSILGKGMKTENNFQLESD